MRTNKTIEISSKELAAAKQTASMLVYDSSVKKIADVFNVKSLDEAEEKIKTLTDFSNKTWLLSSILLYTLIYSDRLYRQSGLDWNSYMARARERIGLEQRDISQMLSSARFFILYNRQLVEAGWTPSNKASTLKYAELALSLCGDLDLTISHLISDTWDEFKKWYSSYKTPKNNLVEQENFSYSRGKFLYSGEEAVTISKSIPPYQRGTIRDCLKEVFSILKSGGIPVVTRKDGH